MTESLRLWVTSSLGSKPRPPRSDALRPALRCPHLSKEPHRGGEHTRVSSSHAEHYLNETTLKGLLMWLSRHISIICTTRSWLLYFPNLKILCCSPKSISSPQPTPSGSGDIPLISLWFSIQICIQLTHCLCVSAVSDTISFKEKMFMSSIQIQLASLLYIPIFLLFLFFIFLLHSLGF